MIENKMDYLVMFIMAIIVIIGIYQFYFWCQRNNFRKPVELNCFIDNWFTLKPWWIWIYSGIYYPIIVFMVFSFKDIRHFNYTVLSFFILMLIQMVFFIFFPVQTPPSWRLQVTGKSKSSQFLRYVQSLDKANNCFPSMHVSVSSLTAFHLNQNYSFLDNYIFCFPILIGISALYTKQHFFLDLIPGFLVGYISFEAFLFIYH